MYTWLVVSSVLSWLSNMSEMSLRSLSRLQNVCSRPFHRRIFLPSTEWGNSFDGLSYTHSPWHQTFIWYQCTFEWIRAAAQTRQINYRLSEGLWEPSSTKTDFVAHCENGLWHNHVNRFQVSIIPSICKKIGNINFYTCQRIEVRVYIVQCNVDQSNVLKNPILSCKVQNFQSCWQDQPERDSLV